MANQNENFVRPPETKPFVVNSDYKPGASEIEKYNSIPFYEDLNQLHSMCTMYAQSYSIVMLKRIKAEKEDFFDEAGISENEMIAHLTNNLCLPYSKIRSIAYRQATATIKDQ